MRNDKKFLEDLCAEQVEIDVYLVNGIRLKGYLECHLPEAIVLNDGVQGMLVYKHAVSTIVGARKKRF